MRRVQIQAIPILSNFGKLDTEESIESGYTRENEERTTENKMERRVSTRSEKYWTESGRGDGQGDVEKKDHQSYRRPYMMGKARGKLDTYSFGRQCALLPFWNI